MLTAEKNRRVSAEVKQEVRTLATTHPGFAGAAWVAERTANHASGDGGDRSVLGTVLFMIGDFRWRFS
jgi:hypothetical protein